MATSKMRTIGIGLMVIVTMTLPVRSQLPPDDCSWQAKSASEAAAPRPAASTSVPRRIMKSRTAKDGKSYTKYNKGKAIDITGWFKFTCGLDALIPKALVDSPIEGAENVRVTLRGYLMGAKFMREGDHDIHVELAASPEWDSDHVVVEMSAGTEYCKARKALMDLVRKDGCKDDVCMLKKPVRISVTGYVLVGTPPAGASDLCHAVSTRGMKKEDQISHVRGIWRLQPVLTVKKN